MKKYFFFASLVLFLASPVLAKPLASWKPKTPDGYSQISWVKAPGIVSFVKTPQGNGSTDFLTVIYLPYNHVQLISSSTPRQDWGPGVAPFDVFGSRNWAVPRVSISIAKIANPKAQFVWNGPFFNTGLSVSDLSLALKTKDSLGVFVSSGSRPVNDTALPRRMLTIDNARGIADVIDFDATIFADVTSSDQAVEGFSPTVGKNDGPQTARLFLGVRADGTELVVYCSQQASPSEASDQLVAAGVPVENQMQLDGGGSAACGYNLPGQFFVEPSRTLPYMMGAFNIAGRGTVNNETLNVRSGAGTKFEIVKKLSKGDRVEIFETKNGWHRIGEGQWVLASYVKKI